MVAEGVAHSLRTLLLRRCVPAAPEEEGEKEEQGKGDGRQGCQNTRRPADKVRHRSVLEWTHAQPHSAHEHIGALGVPSEVTNVTGIGSDIASPITSAT